MANYLGEIILVGFNFPPAGWAFCNGQLLPISEHEGLFVLIGTTYGGNGETTFALPDLRSRVPTHQGQAAGLSSYFIGETTGAEAVTLQLTQIPAHTHTIDTSGMTVTARCRNGAANTATPLNAVPAIEAPAAFTDSTLTAGVTGAKAVHVNELRARINGQRAKHGLGPFSFADPTLTGGATLIKPQHITEMRTALAAAYTSAGLPPPTYTDPTITPNITGLKAVHLTELRARVDALGHFNATPYINAAPDANMNTGAIVIGGTATAAATGGSQPHNNMQPYLTLNYCICLTGVFPTQS